MTMPPTHTHAWMQAYRPESSVRPVEVATAVALIMLAMALRWAPSRAAGSALQQTAISSAEWASRARPPSLRQALSAVFTGCAVGLFIGGAGGLFCGMLSSAGVLVFGSRRLSDREKQSRLRLIAAAPPVVDLFAAGLAAGLLPADAASAAATAFMTREQDPPVQAIPELPAQAPLAARSDRRDRLDRFDAKPLAPYPGRLARFRLRQSNPSTTRPIEPTLEIAERFAAAARALRQGADPETAWHPLAVDSATAPVAAAAVRASRTGAPASETVAKAARDLWSCAEHASQAQLRSAAVRAAMPLALCFLPAFVLLGIVPTMIGVLAELRA